MENSEFLVFLQRRLYKFFLFFGMKESLMVLNVPVLSRGLPKIWVSSNGPKQLPQGSEMKACLICFIFGRQIKDVCWKVTSVKCHILTLSHSLTGLVYFVSFDLLIFSSLRVIRCVLT